ncbi:annexin D5-like protein [Cinnamomum micranthum f. kanehirae]|uniref:Annexin n=1 Tax=Cinnamomum micranthum f. kanehirae TaxID=337451 RepID=A0A3S3PX04_9MAGN|nr:annexin D5-like protein [Cinnamomum micranthum f. kanehirae]
MAKDVVSAVIVVGDDKKDDVGETEAEIAEEVEDDQLDDDYEVDDGVEDLDDVENEEDLDGDDQPSIETNINKGSTENPNIATDTAEGDAPSDAKGSVKEQMDSGTDAYKDAKQQADASQKTVLDAYKDVKQQIGGVCQLFAPSNNNNTPAAANQQQQPQPQPQRRRPQQTPQGRRQTQQKVSVPTPQEQQPMESVSTPQPPTQPRQRPQKQRQPQKKVSVTPQAQQPQQQPQQKVSVSPLQAQAQAQQQVIKVSGAPPNTEPQPPQQSVTQANPSVREKGTIPSGGVNLPTPEEDATTLYTAFKGRGCDVGRLVHLLTKRDATHLQLIQKHYKKNYGEDLTDRISSELSKMGDFKEKAGLDLTANPTGTLSRTFSSDIKRAVSLWMLEESERDATIVWQALQVTSFDKAAVTEVICSRTPSQLCNIQQAYRTKFSPQLLQEINSSNLRFYGHHKELLIACLDYQSRDEGKNVDLKMAEEDAKQLYQDGEKIWGTNDKTFIDIFTKRNRPHLAAVDAAYQKLYGHSLEKAVEKETSGSYEDGLLTLLRCAKNPAKYFAEVLYNAMKGAGTSDTTLIRTVVTRAGIDMEDVKKEYAQAYKKSLKDAIHKDTSGDYRTFLISLVE